MELSIANVITQPEITGIALGLSLLNIIFVLLVIVRIRRKVEEAVKGMSLT
jgi:hypothetical protein